MRRPIFAGVVNGAVATVAMSSVMLAGKALGLLGDVPPRRIVDGLARLVGRRRRSTGTRNAVAVITHFGFGSVSGALYATLVAPRAPPSLPAPLLGAAFGGFVWAASYAGWVPALGILPFPTRDRPGRPLVMILDHLVYGAVLGHLCDGVGRPTGQARSRA